MEKTKLYEEVVRLQRADDQNLHDWLGSNVNGLITSIGAVAIGGFALVRYFKDREDTRISRQEQDQDRLEDQEAERQQRAEERFHRVVQGLGADQLSARIGAAVTLRMFLQHGDERFFAPVFDLASAHLKLTENAETGGGAEGDVSDRVQGSVSVSEG